MPRKIAFLKSKMICPKDKKKLVPVGNNRLECPECRETYNRGELELMVQEEDDEEDE